MNNGSCHLSPKWPMGWRYLYSMADAKPIIWITGQPGAGKSTVGRALLEALESKGKKAFMVDGDVLSLERLQAMLAAPTPNFNIVLP